MAISKIKSESIDLTDTGYTFGDLLVSGDLTIDTSSLTVDSANNRVGIGTTSPSTILDIQGGNITQGATGSNAGRLLIDNTTDTIQRIKVSRGGSTGQLAFHTGTDSEAMRITNSGNVGIGTSSPTAKLDIIETVASTTSSIWTGETLALKDDTAYAQGVGGALIFEGKYNSSGSYSTFGYIRGSKNDASDGGFQGGIVYGTRNGDHVFVTASNGQTDGTNERMRINSSGNVGIGTTNPSARLEVEDAGTSNSVILKVTADDGGPYAFVVGNDTYSTTDTEGMTMYVSDAGVGTLNVRGAGSELAMRTVGTERMRIDSSGNVGINTSSPSTKLEVRDGARGIVIKSTGDTGYTQGSMLIEGHETNNTPQTRGQGIYLFNHGNDLNWYMGTTYQGGGNFAICSLSNTTQQNSTADDNNSRFVIDTSGNVGIGIISPNNYTNYQTLTINGTTGGVLDFESNGTLIGEIFNDSNKLIIQSISTNLIVFKTNNSERMRITTSGVVITGSLSKSSGSFRIPHPLPEKTNTHDLVHSFIEAPQADNIYRGKVDLVNGTATVNIDTVAGMTEGTFVLLNREIQCFTSNETGWTAVRGSVSGNILTITAQDETCTDTISWLVIGERQDQHMYDTEWTDENGKVIVEPLKPVEE